MSISEMVVVALLALAAVVFAVAAVRSIAARRALKHDSAPPERPPHQATSDVSKQVRYCKRQLQRMKRNEAKRWINLRADIQWAAIKNGYCGECMGAGYRRSHTVDPDRIDEWLSSDDEPDWEAQECWMCKGSGTLPADAQAQMLGLLDRMIAERRKFEGPLEASITEGMRAQCKAGKDD